MLPANAALVIIDVQKGFDDPVWGPRNNPQAEANMTHLLQAWRASGRPVFHIQHLSTEADSPLRPNQSGCDIKDDLLPQPGEILFEKRVNSAFIGTHLELILHEKDIDTLVIVGLTTNHCVSTTARMAGNLGFVTYVVSDATAAFDRVGPGGEHYSADIIHAISLANLHGEFATVIDTNSVLHQLE